MGMTMGSNEAERIRRWLVDNPRPVTKFAKYDFRMQTRPGEFSPAWVVMSAVARCTVCALLWWRAASEVMLTVCKNCKPRGTRAVTRVCCDCGHIFQAKARRKTRRCHPCGRENDERRKLHGIRTVSDADSHTSE